MTPVPTAAGGTAWRLHPVLGSAALLALLAIAVHARTIGHGFIWDDGSNVTANETLRSLGGLARIWLDPRAQQQQYYPLTHTSFWIQYQIFGLQPWAFHLGNVLLHALSAVLLWRILRGLALPGAWLAAALWAVHPLQVETVAWITERKNTLSGVFMMLAALLFFRHAGVLDPGPAGEAPAGRPSEQPGRVGPAPIASRRGAVGWTALAVFLVALSAKTAVATAPVALLAVLWWKRDRLRRADWVGILPFALLGIGSGLVSGWLEKHHAGAVGEGWSLDLSDRIVMAGRGVWFYAGKFIWPVGQCFIYPRWDTDSGRAVLWLFPAGAAAVLAVLWALRGRVGKGPVAAAVVYGALIAPASGFFDLYFFRYAPAQDHFQYFASIGLSALAVGLLARAARRRETFMAVGAALLTVLGAMSWQRSGVFRDSERLWRDTIARNPDAWMAHSNLGTILLNRGRLDEAAGHYEEALRINPKSTEVNYNMGLTLERNGRIEEAIARQRQVLALNPEYGRAHAHLGGLLALQHKDQEALTHLDRAVEISPDYAWARTARGNLLVRLGRLDAGIPDLRRALELDPDDAGTRASLAGALAATGPSEEAREPASRAAELGSGVGTSLLDAGNALLRAGHLAEALDTFTRAASSPPGSAEAHYDRGLVLERLGRLPEAIQAYREAIRLQPDLKVAHNNLAIALYAAGSYAEAWQEVSTFESLGGRLHPGFLEALSGRMPRP